MMNRPEKARGSILIWTLLIGISLATVFFFFSQRLNSNVEAQHETIEYQNNRLFYESYINYIKSLDRSELESMRNATGGIIDFEGIEGYMTNETQVIRGVLDAGEERTYVVAGDEAKIAWNLCKDVGGIKVGAEVGTMEIDPPGTVFDNACNSDYALWAPGTIGTFKIKAVGAPLSYLLSPIGSATLYDNEWSLFVEFDIGFRRKLVTNIFFTPDS